ALEAGHRDGPLAPLVGAEHRRLELLLRGCLDVLEREVLLPADGPQPAPHLHGVGPRLRGVVEFAHLPVVPPEDGPVGPARPHLVPLPLGDGPGCRDDGTRDPWRWTTTLRDSDG